MTLHPAIGANRYCGPGALAMLLGIDTGEAARQLRERSGKRFVKRIAPGFVVDVLSQAAPVEEVTVEGSPALERWAEACEVGCYLVMVTGHFVVARKGPDGRVEAGDNQSVYPRELAEFPRRRMKVRRVWRVGE